MSRFGMVAAVALVGAALGGEVLAPQACAQQVAVMQGDTAGEYRALGVVSVEVHQKTVFVKVPMQQQLDDALRAEAAKLGADAVIQVKYQTSNALTSKKGNQATGVAVKFARPIQMAAAPVTSPPAPAIAPAPPKPASAAAPLAAPAPATAPTVVVPPAAPPVAVAAAPAAPAPVRHAAIPAMIMLSEQDLPGQRYVRIGEVNAVTHQTSMFPKKPPMDTLKSALQSAAARIGADAVIQVKYKMSNAMLSKDGNTAVGVAVRFE